MGSQRTERTGFQTEMMHLLESGDSDGGTLI